MRGGRIGRREGREETSSKNISARSEVNAKVSVHRASRTRGVGLAWGLRAESRQLRRATLPCKHPTPSPSAGLEIVLGRHRRQECLSLRIGGPHSRSHLLERRDRDMKDREALANVAGREVVAGIELDDVSLPAVVLLA